LSLGAFAGTNVDDLLMLGGQFAAVEKEHHRRIAEGQLAAIALVIGLCAVVGSAIESAPHRAIGACLG